MPQHVCFVTITATNEEKTVFVEFPADALLLEEFDPADRKFVAVANCAWRKAANSSVGGQQVARLGSRLARPRDSARSALPRRVGSN